jgi:plastocyanin domain-containing protein
MSLDKLLVATLGGFLIFFIYWFFFGKRDSIVRVKGITEIVVDGGYKPQVIRINPNESAELTFIRKDANSCLEEIIFPDYGIKKYLPMNTPVNITLNPPHGRASEFHCGINMYRGKVVASD